MADSGHPPAELHERLLICRTIKLNAGAHGGHRRCCHAKMQKNAQNKPQIARLILCVHTTLQVYCNLFLTFCIFFCFIRRKDFRAIYWQNLSVADATALPQRHALSVCFAATSPIGRGTGVPVRPTRDEQSLILLKTVVPCYRGQQLRDNIPCQAAVNLCSRALFFTLY